MFGNQLSGLRLRPRTTVTPHNRRAIRTRCDPDDIKPEPRSGLPQGECGCPERVALERDGAMAEPADRPLKQSWGDPAKDNPQDEGESWNDADAGQRKNGKPPPRFLWSVFGSHLERVRLFRHVGLQRCFPPAWTGGRVLCDKRASACLQRLCTDLGRGGGRLKVDRPGKPPRITKANP